MKISIRVAKISIDGNISMRPLDFSSGNVAYNELSELIELLNKKKIKNGGYVITRTYVGESPAKWVLYKRRRDNDVSFKNCIDLSKISLVAMLTVMEKPSFINVNVTDNEFTFIGLWFGTPSNFKHALVEVPRVKGDK